MLKVDPQDKRLLIDPLFAPAGRIFWLAAAGLSSVLVWGIWKYAQQYVLGLGETGMNRPSYWGVYMVNFVFFIGISHAGTLISAILRVTGAEWRRPITRIAEAITAFALVIGTLQIIIDMGRPDRLLFVILHGRLQSPILWDVISVTMYFLGSITYLYLPLIPDAAILRDNCPENAPEWRKKLYTIVSLGWRGNRTQWVRLEKAISAMAVFIIPVAVSVHTIISWILATTVQPGWHSSIFGPYFVVGAIFSGIAALFLAMSAIRVILGLEGYISTRQYRNLGLLFLTMNLIWFYFTYAEHLSIAAGQQSDEFPVLASKLWGEFAPGFWFMVSLMAIGLLVLIIPKIVPPVVSRMPVFRPGVALTSLGAAGLIFFWLVLAPGLVPRASFSLPVQPLVAWILLSVLLLSAGIGLFSWLRTRPIAATIIASGFVVIGMWLERWNIIVPTMTHARLIPYSVYIPTATEISLTAGSLALFGLMFLFFFKLFPSVSIWEFAEGRVIEGAREKITIPSPEPSETKRLRQWGFRR